MKSNLSSKLEYEYLSFKIEALTNALKNECIHTEEQLFLKKMDVNSRFGTPGRLHWPYIGNTSQQTEEAVASIIRLLAMVRDKNLHILDWLDTVSNVGLSLLDLGLYNNALTIYQYACDNWKILFSEQPQIFGAAFASCLHNLSFTYKAIGKYIEALDVIEEVVCIRRKIFVPTPYAFLPDLSCSLMLRADCYRHLQRFQCALQSASEGVRIIRGLAFDNPDGFNRELANSLLDQAALLYDVGDCEGCLLCIEEMLKALCQLAPVYADVFVYEIAAAHYWTGMAYQGIGDLYFAEYSARKAVQMGRELYRNQPRLEAPIFWQSLTTLSEILHISGDYEESLRLNEEALDICSFLPQHEHDKKKTYAYSLRQRALVLGQMNRHNEALKYTIEAVNTYRQLIESGYTGYTYEQELAVTLKVQSSCLRELHRYDDSLQSINETVEIGKDQNHDDSRGEDLIYALHEQSSALAVLNDYSNAYPSITRAVELRRILMKMHPTDVMDYLNDNQRLQ